MRELGLEDCNGYKEMLRMNHNLFNVILTSIEKDVTPHELQTGGLNPIKSN